MPSDLNETIDAVFRGLVFIVYDYVFSIARITRRPVRGSLSLVRRFSAPNIKQIGPYVFMFMSFFAGLSVPYYFSRNINFYAEEYPGSSETNTSVQQAYAHALDVFEPKFLLATALSCVLMSVLLDGTTSFFASLCARTRLRRSLIKNSLLYLAGYQVFTVTAAIVGMFYWSGWAWHGVFLQEDFSILPKFVGFGLSGERGWKIVLSVVVYSAGVGLCLYALAAPLLLLRAFFTGPRMPTWLNRVPVAGSIAVGGIAFSAFVTASYALGNWTMQSIKPEPPWALVVSNVECIRSSQHPDSIIALAAISNPTSNTMTLSNRALQIWLVAELTPEEARRREAAATDPRQRIMYARQKTPTSHKSLPVKILNSSQGVDRPTYLVAAGQAIWLQATTTKPVTPFDYAEDDTLHCGVALANFDPEPVAYAVITDEASGEVLTSKHFHPAPAEPAAKLE